MAKRGRPGKDLAGLMRGDAPDGLPPGDTVIGFEEVRLSDFRGRAEAGARETLEWVFNNIDVAGLKPKDAPSPGAWSLLVRVRAVPDLMVDFYKQVWPKLLPNKAQIEAEARMKAGGTDEIERSLARVEEALGPAGPPAEYQF